MREKINFNNDWRFSRDKENVYASEQITLPHTWNAADGTDGGNDYYRGKCWYAKKFKDPRKNKDQEVWLELEGAAMSSEVFLNGTKLGEHEGGFSAFRVPLHKALQPENELLVSCDNSENDRVYPQKADFTFYGGLYRDVNLVVCSPAHFVLDENGSKGLEVDYVLDLENRSVDVTLSAKAVNAKEDSIVRFEIDGLIQEVPVTNGVAKGTLHLDNVRLWDGRKDPFLYEVKAVLDGEDETSLKIGFRKMEVDPGKGFILNGKPLRLIGAARHQDREGLGNALSEKEHREDIELLLEMGCTGVRLAHYQHDQKFYDLCDQKGLVVWAEIPYITSHLDHGKENTLSQLQELIVQNKHHPSIFCWALSNEITVHGGWNEKIQDNHEALRNLAHQLDPSRPTSMAHAFMLEMEHPFARFADLNSYNLYYGWYLGELFQNDLFFDEWHKNYPDVPVGLAEYGADANPAYQNSRPDKGDWTEGYQAIYHEHMLKMWNDRPWIWNMFCWNMFDFGADGRNEGGKPGQNQKGLVTFDRRTKKDAFYLYKAYLSDEPFVHICGRRYVNRPEKTTELKVYSNQPQVSLYVDGNLYETAQGDKIFKFNVDLSTEHTITAKAGDLVDAITIRKVDQPDPSYVKEGGSVTNWFDRDDEIAREGYLSILDSMLEIKSSVEGAKIVEEIISEARKGYGDVAKGTTTPPSIQRQMDMASMQSLLKQAGSVISPSRVREINARLNQIPKDPDFKIH